MARKRGHQQHNKRDSSNRQQRSNAGQSPLVSGSSQASNETNNDSRSSSTSKVKQNPTIPVQLNQSSSDSFHSNSSYAIKKIASQLNTGLLNDQDFVILMNNRLYDKVKLESWWKAFKEDCPTGRMDKQQLSDAFAHTYGERKRNHFISSTFRAFDPDNTGSIGFVSFLLALTLASSSVAEDKLKMIFAFFAQRISESIETNRLIKDLTSIVQIIYDMVDEENRANLRSPKSRVQHAVKLCNANSSFGADNGQSKAGLTKSKYSADHLLKACLEDPILMEIAQKSIITSTPC